jgi:predicted transcriptional regulator
MKIFDEVGRDTTAEVDPYPIGKELGLDTETTKHIIRNLAHQNLLKQRGIGNQVSITHDGIERITGTLVP